MKNLLKRFIKKAKAFFSWVWQECKDKRTLILLLIVCAVVGSPVWISYLLWVIFGWNWALVTGSAMLAFWWLPGAPYFALCVAITLGIKKFIQKRKNGNK